MLFFSVGVMELLVFPFNYIQKLYFSVCFVSVKRPTDSIKAKLLICYVHNLLAGYCIDENISFELLSTNTN